MEIYDSIEAYNAQLEKRAVLPAGFHCAHTSIEFTPREKPVKAKMNLSLILADRKTASFGAMYTRNSFPGTPVLIGRQRLGNPYMQGFLINNKISNVYTPDGEEAACFLLDKLAAVLQTDSSLLLPFSTGIIGWQLPVREMSEALGPLAAGLSGDSLLPVARAIMTTDSFPKARSVQVGGGMITGIAKGAGMIEPNMATMLVFLLTDIDIPRKELRHALDEAVRGSFNCISVDGDQSTSDSAVIMSSCLKPSPGYGEFAGGLLSVCEMLAEDIVRNGEGTGHVIRVTVEGDLPEDTALALGKAVVNSPLCKTAIFGNDPNVGRIISAIGDYIGSHGTAIDQSRLVLTLGGFEIFRNNRFLLDIEKEKKLAAYLADCSMDTPHKGYPPHNRLVEIGISFGGNAVRRSVLGSDLSCEYVRENADYRS